MNACTRLLLPLVLAFPALPVLADDDRAINVETYRAAVLQASGHPNELSRWHGMWTFDNGRADEAIGHFQRAAGYGDKLSQHFLTLMYWNGEGIDRDPVLAYVWADLAAERGNSDMLIRIREKIWSEADHRSSASGHRHQAVRRSRPAPRRPAPAWRSPPADPTAAGAAHKRTPAPPFYADARTRPAAC